MQCALTSCTKTAPASSRVFRRFAKNWAAAPAAATSVTRAQPKQASGLRHMHVANTMSEAVLMRQFPVSFSPKFTMQATRNVLEDIDLMVYDMAGTVVAEGGIVYKTLQGAMLEDGINVETHEMHPWHGAKKEAVIEHFARRAGTPEADMEERVTRVGDWFVGKIDEAYFGPSSPIDYIDDNLMSYFKQLKAAGIKISLDTGYPPNIQEGLVQKLGFDKIVDAYVSSYQVAEGRPFPYMIYRLMERTGVMDVKRVCKVGDSVRDIEEGRNAGCGLVVGVLSGADSYEDFMAAGADLVCNNVTDLPVPQHRVQLV